MKSFGKRQVKSIQNGLLFSQKRAFSFSFPQFKNIPLETSSKLFQAAFNGSIEGVDSLLRSDSSIVRIFNEDKRTLLHLAVSEGHKDLVRYLVEQGADINAKDRWEVTPLQEAMESRRYEIFDYLLSKGGKTYMSDIDKSTKLIGAVRDGDTELVKALVNLGADVNLGDYDSRTALHIACDRGFEDIAEFLIENGAKVNILDNFGRNPVQDAIQNKHDNLVEYLFTKGAVLPSFVQDVIKSPELASSLQKSLPILGEREGFEFVEVYVPSRNNNDVERYRVSYSDKNRVPIKSNFLLTYSKGQGLAGRVFESKSVVFANEITKDYFNNYEELKKAGVTSAVGVPIFTNSKSPELFSVLIFYNFEDNQRVPNIIKSPEYAQQFARFANALVTAGIETLPNKRLDATPSESLVDEIFTILESRGVFDPTLAFYEIDRYINYLGFSDAYFNHFTNEEIADHIHSLMAAKKMAETSSGNPEDIRFYKESKDRAYFMCNASPEKINQLEQRIEKYLNSTESKHGYSLDHFLTPGTIIPNGTERLAMYVVNRYEDIGKETRSLLKQQGKHETTISRYEKIISQAENQLTPVLQSFDAEEDGTVPIMLAFQNPQKSYLNSLTEIMESIPGIQCNRKFVEKFSNSGLAVYSMYVTASKASEIQELLNKSSLLSIIPTTSLNELLISRKMTARQVFYAYTVTKFCFYFTEQVQEEYELLKNHLANDPTNLSRLVRLHSKQFSDALTEERIFTCIKSHLPIMHQIFVDFAKIASGERKPSFNTELSERIRREVTSPLDSLILNSFLKFNAHLLKTNFYKFDKAAISFRLDPGFLKGTKYPEVPYGVFLVIGNDFTGFHIRFNDVARGGVRVIRSLNEHAYRLNQIGLFSEAYGLAYTQQKKNKDIPEGGSKGALLLAKDAQDNIEIAFKKYVDSLLDLLLLNENTTDVTDHYKKEEILFLGPDENTANLMDWAALHSKSRGYKFWKAFTTGKSTSIGGIPHDVYGMTTTSVHENALGVMRRLGLEETKITKFQTGGPDGDLGSNEILMSQDKTISIVDGKGVLYDPEGIDREELTRLAKLRVTSDHFDVSKLGPKGFRVTIDDKNVILPHGEVVENGLIFRNNFHLHPLASADFFIPCGGRPESVNISNVNQLIVDGKPRWKYIIEGANLFITQEAREILEKHGVVLYKDASANKGGVTSSSLEVLAALSFSNEEFHKNMQVKDGVIPDFYQTYVKNVIEKITQNARNEFDCIWEEHERSKIPRCQLTNILSDKINKINEEIKKSSVWEDQIVKRNVLEEALPKTLLNELGLDTILQRVPESYLKAIFGAHLASSYIYKYGLTASEFDFYEFLTKYSK